MKIKTEKLKKRNIELARKVDELQNYIDTEIALTKEQREYLDSLIISIQETQNKWLQQIEDLETIKDKYVILIRELQLLRKSMISNDLKIKISLRDRIKYFLQK